MLPNLENTFVKSNRLRENFVKYFYNSFSIEKKEVMQSLPAIRII